ncbi:GDCCVxC domain-containing (seleno)protein [Pseudoalteromonas sp. D48-MNA-CIBAN-0056]|uniref:GDCCVxC domain-containing (seleno)protein n=1 Tax=Pseudoalteromonas sp. D48-MNA-CIBAN-0056 TaxID=3140417 RepID=UPI0033288384
MFTIKPESVFTITGIRTMPTNACQWYYECESCKALLKPLKGDCCVYCSYGTVKCPPIQEGNACCSGK